MDHTTGSLLSTWTAMEQPNTCPRESPHGAHKVKTSQVEGEQTSDGPGNNRDLSSALQDPEQSLFSSVRQLHFKTSLVEMVEELRMLRDSEHNFEEKYNKVVLEKQELEWEKDSVASKRESLLTEHSEEIRKTNKQFQSKLESLEAEKNKFKFLLEAAEREVNSLKEKMKAQHLSMHSLQKSLADQDHKLQLQMLGKERVLSQLSEVGNIHSKVRKQCETYRQAHELLERNVQEQLKLNKKLMYANKHQACTQKELTQRLQQVSAELLRAKVDIQSKTDEIKREKIERQCKLEETQHQLQKELDRVRQLSQEQAIFQQEKLEMTKTLEESNRLIERQGARVNRTKEDNAALLQKIQALTDDNENLIRRMMENDENFKNIKGHLEITLQEEKRKDKFRFESLQSKYDILNSRFQDIEESNSELKLKLTEQEKKNNDFQHCLSYKENENKMIIDGLKSTVAVKELEICAFCRTNKECASKGTQRDNQSLDTVSDTIISHEVLKKREHLAECQKEVELRVNDISDTDACLTTDECSGTNPVPCASPQVCVAQEEKSETQSHLVEDCIAVTGMKTEIHLNLISPEKQVMANICEVTEEAELLDVILQNAKVSNSSENLCKQNVSQIQTNPTISVAMQEPKPNNENSEFASHKISYQEVLGENNKADRNTDQDNQFILAEANLNLTTSGNADNVNKSSTITHWAPDSVSNILPLLTKSLNEGIQSVTSVPKGMDDQLVTSHEERPTSVGSGEASFNLPNVQLVDIAIDVATADKQSGVALPDADSIASIVEICEQIKMTSTEVRPAVGSNSVACEENPLTDASSTVENNVIDFHAIGDGATKHASPDTKLTGKDEQIVTQPSQSLNTVMPTLPVTVDGSVTYSETQACAAEKLPDQSPSALECSQISEKYEDVNGEITLLRQSITDNKQSLCAPTDARKRSIFSFSDFINVYANKPMSSINTKSNRLIDKCLIENPAMETTSVAPLKLSHVTYPKYCSMYKHFLSEGKNIEAPTSHAQSRSPYPTSASNTTERGAYAGDRSDQGGRGEPSSVTPQVARHMDPAAVTRSSAAHDTLTSPLDRITNQNTKNVFGKYNSIWARSSSSSSAGKLKFQPGLPGNRSHGIFPGDVVGGAKRKRDYIRQWNAIAETFDVEQPSSKRDSIEKGVNVSTSHKTAPVRVLPGPGMGLEVKHNVNDLDLVTFSDDENESWTMENQITDIQKLLNVDRLKLAKTRRCSET